MVSRPISAPSSLSGIAESCSIPRVLSCFFMTLYGVLGNSMASQGPSRLRSDLSRLLRARLGLSTSHLGLSPIVLGPHKLQLYGLLIFKREVKVRRKLLLGLLFQRVSVKQESSCLNFKDF
jgi:hypothetical protein